MGNINKYEKFLEEMRIKNFKNMDDWSPKAEKKVSKSNKKINEDNGKKFIELFEKYNIQVDFGNGEISDIYKFDDEKKLKEVRIGLYSFTNYDEWKDYNGYTEEYLDKENILSEEEYKKEYEEYLTNNNNEIVSFSVFLGSNNNSKNLNLCMGDAYIYLTEKLKNIDIYHIIDAYSFEHIDEIKTYINNIDFNINKSNIDELPDIARRLRMDSKVFYYIEDEHFTRDYTEFSYQDFINDLKKL